MRLGILTPSLSRAAGGMFWSVRALTQATIEHGWNPTVFAGEDQYSGIDQAAWAPARTHVLQQWGPRIFGYLPGLAHAMHDEQPDLLHVHGLWMYTSVASNAWRARYGRPYVISPHGMLDPWALKNSRYKKWLVSVLFENRHLRNADCLRALCQAEAEAMRAIGLRNPICVIPNGVDLDFLQSNSNPPWHERFEGGSRILLYIGRIHPKKNLGTLITAWALNHEIAKSGEWHLVIAGWDQGEHQAELKSLAIELGVADSIHFIGPIFDEAKRAALSAASAFVLPSLSEGLPMAVLEAWAAKLPVLMTDACNLPEGFAEQAAIRLPLQAREMAHAMRDFLMQPPSRLTDMGLRGQDLVARKFSWGSVGREMSAVYGWLCGGTARPQTVLEN